MVMACASLAFLLAPALADTLSDWAAYAGTPQSYTPYSTPYTGAESWYCSRAVGSDGSCNAAGLFTSSSAAITALFASPPPIGVTTPNKAFFSPNVIINNTSALIEVPLYPAGNYPSQYVGLSGAGAAFSLCPDGGCIGGDTERTANFFRTTTLQSVLIGEYDTFLGMHNATGLAANWRTAVAYPANSYVHSSGSGTDQIYFSAAGGTSGATAPNCLSGICSDGTITWTWQSGGINDQKVGIGLDGDGYAGGGHHWNIASALTIWPGYFPFLSSLTEGGFATNVEIDTLDMDRDAPPATANGPTLDGVFLNGIGVSGKAGTVGLLAGGQTLGSELFHWGWGILPYYAKDLGMFESSYATVGFSHTGGGNQVNAETYAGTHSGATIVDSSTGTYGSDYEGTYSVAALNIGAGKGDVRLGRHINGVNMAAPTTNASCKSGTGYAMAAGANDLSGYFILGTTATSGCTLSFAYAYASASFCIAWDSSAAVPTLIAITGGTSTTTTLPLGTTIGGHIVNWVCTGN